MKKSRYDVSMAQRDHKTECEARMAEISAAKPDDYFQDDEYQLLRAQVRIADLKIRLYDKQIKNGVKY